MLRIGIASLLVAGAVSWLATPWVVRLAGRLGAVDLPGRRKLHSAPIPRIGGMAVFLGFIAGLAFAALLTDSLFQVPAVGIYWRGLALAAAGLFLVGLVDDLLQISFRWKLAAQIVAAIYIWTCGFRIEAVSHPLGGDLHLGLFSFPVTLLWIVGITNAVNLIDGLDGLAAGTAVIMTGALGILAFQNGHLGVTAASVALAGSLVGFLWFNFNPARIYLGDSGSLFLGFVLAVLAVRGSQKGPAVVAIFVPLLVLGLPLLDTSFAVLRRAFHLGNSGIKSGSPLRYVVRNLDHLFLPDRGHIHHRLLDLGMSHRGAVLMLYGVVTLLVTAAFALVLLKSLLVATMLAAVLIVLSAVFFVLLYFKGRKIEKTEAGVEPIGAGSKLARASSGAALERR